MTSDSNPSREWTSLGYTDPGAPVMVAPANTAAPQLGPTERVSVAVEEMPPALPQPWYAFGTLASPTRRVEVLVRLDEATQQVPELRAVEDLTRIDPRMPPRSWTATVAGEPDQLGQIVDDLSHAPRLQSAQVLELAVPGSTHQVTVQEVQTSTRRSMAHRRATPAFVTITGQGSPFLPGSWNADQEVPQAARLVPDGYRMIGGSTRRLPVDGRIGGRHDMEILLDAAFEGRRYLSQGAPHAPLLTAIDYIDQDTLVVWVVAIEEILSGPFEATLIDGPAQGNTLPLPHPRRVIEAMPPTGLRMNGSSPEIPDPVLYRPVPGRPRWYSVNGGPLT